MNIVIPSYNRSSGLLGKDYFISAKYVIPHSQRDEYSKAVGADKIIVIDDEQDGSITKKRNWILNNIPRPLVMIDDDVSSIGYFEGRKGMKDGDHRRKTLKPEQIDWFMNHSFEMAEQFGAKMFGLSQNEDNRIYKEFQPFSLSKIALGPVQGHLDHSLLFDHNVGTKDDYDMALQQLKVYKMIFRWNKFHYICEHGDNTGGIVSQRSMEKEIQYCKSIMLKWGKKIIRYEIPPKKMTDLLNAKKVNVPIAGI